MLARLRCLVGLHSWYCRYLHYQPDPDHLDEELEIALACRRCPRVTTRYSLVQEYRGQITIHWPNRTPEPNAAQWDRLLAAVERPAVIVTSDHPWEVHSSESS